MAYRLGVESLRFGVSGFRLGIGGGLRHHTTAMLDSMQNNLRSL